LTHAHQARAPTDQRAPITRIGAVVYLANLGRAADQIGGYIAYRATIRLSLTVTECTGSA
jgi:hypothetical protein